MGTERPCHLIAEVGDNRTLCGIRRREKAFYPHLLARFLDAHRTGNASVGKTFLVCPDCERVNT